MTALPYHLFCPAGSRFYDRAEPAPEAAFELRIDGWAKHENDDWSTWLPPDPALPEQGWKVHVSATPTNASEVLQITADFCRTHIVAFKHLRGIDTLLLRNSKYGDRGASGKFLTLYPRDVDQLECTLTVLGGLLAGQPGPYILTDVRWLDGPLYVRFGGFVTVLGPGPDGQLVPCLRRPDGTLVPDLRKPGFRVPDWVTPPAMLAPAIAARSSGTLTDFPFVPEAALHFSNGGGVYRARDTRDNKQVLMKEARPYAGLDELGRDAVERLERERWALDRLAPVTVVPQLIDYRRGHEHYFLVREYVDGKTLAHAVWERNPHLGTDRGERWSVTAYTEWALEMLATAERGMRAMHERGVVYGDLHLNNILLTDEDEMRFIDMETADRDIEGFTPRIGAPGFRAPDGIRGTAVDDYALACCRLAVFLPLTAVIGADSANAERLIAEVESRFPVGPDFGASVRRGLGIDGRIAPGNLRIAEASVIVPSVLAQASPERSDRLFPGDVRQLLGSGAGVGLAYGAAGVLWGIHELGHPVPDRCLSWLDRQVEDRAWVGSGLATGAAGIAVALRRLGRGGAAAAILDELAGTRPTGDPGLEAGDSGRGLALLDAGRFDAASELAEGLAAQFAAGPSPDHHPGIWRGWSGATMLWSALDRTRGDARFRELILAALRHDLDLLDWGLRIRRPAGGTTPL